MGPCAQCGGRMEQGQAVLYVDHSQIYDDETPINDPVICCCKTCAVEYIGSLDLPRAKRRKVARSAEGGQA